jgi:hypothetical protein
VSNADLGFLHPLFELADSLTDADDAAGMSFGLGEPDGNSALGRDDVDLEGMWVSHVVIGSFTASLDHIIQLRELVIRPEAAVTLNAPWTLVRGALEPAAVALWVLSGGTRATRQSRALRVWHHDFTERGAWEKETQRKQPPNGMSGDDRAKGIATLASRLGLEGSKVVTPLNYGDTVGAAGTAAGWKHRVAMARWREASAFAHGRTWPLLKLAEPTSAEVIRGGFALRMVLDERHFEPVARLTHDVLHKGLVEYAALSGTNVP